MEKTPGIALFPGRAANSPVFNVDNCHHTRVRQIGLGTPMQYRGSIRRLGQTIARILRPLGQEITG